MEYGASAITRFRRVIQRLSLDCPDTPAAGDQRVVVPTGVGLRVANPNLHELQSIQNPEVWIQKSHPFVHPSS